MGIFDPLTGVLGDLFGGGGGSGAPDSFAAFLEWLKGQQARLLELEGREKERAEAVTELRRGDILDRPGFAGLVNVGPAQRRSDATLAAEMALLPEDDPTRQTFETAVAEEREQRGEALRVVTGEQFRAEDALAAIREQFEDFQPSSLITGGSPGEGLEDFLSEAEALGEEFPFLDVDTLIADIQAQIEEDEARRNAQLSREESREQRIAESEAIGGE